MRHVGSVPETRGGVFIRGLCESQTEATIYVRFEDADADSWKPVRMDELLAGWEKLNKDKHGQACYDQMSFFSIFPISGWYGGQGGLVVLATLS